MFIKNNFNGNILELEQKAGNQMLEDIYTANGYSLSNLWIEGVEISGVTKGIVFGMRNTTFSRCKFVNVDFSNGYFANCKMEKCKFVDCPNIEEWSKKEGLIMGEEIKPLKILTPTNEEIERSYKCKVYSLPNKSFVKVKWTCDFCHKEWYEIYRRDRVLNPLLEVPNCDKMVCSNCNENYRLREKFMGNRVYGYHGTVHKYKTPIDAEHTAIIGLEMEFEGDFYGWKELQDAHKGMLHYGYDSSVIGQNELSWDCGSYSWWKYLAPLKDVCEVLGKYGGQAGDSAGIHIHVSRDDVNMSDVTYKINSFGQSTIGRALFKAISLRNNAEKFDRYSNLMSEMDAHHAGISYNTYNTCEFRLFNSTLEYRLILKHIKFCKEVFNAFADRKDLWKSFSKETVEHIKNCALIQKNKGFITEPEYKKIIEKLN